MKKAFSMLELVFVIVVIGIIFAVMIPRTNSNRLQEAATQLVSHIKYTQHLAMIDDRYDASNSKWYKERWSIRFNTDEHSNYLEAYTIFADKAGNSTGNADRSEVALDPSNSGIILSGGITGANALDIEHDTFAGNKKLNLGAQYGITLVDFAEGCTQHSFAFDHLGRPMNTALDSYNKSYKTNDLIQTTCEIILTSSEGNITIAIEPETGYAHIL